MKKRLFLYCLVVLSLAGTPCAMAQENTPRFNNRDQDSATHVAVPSFENRPARTPDTGRVTVTGVDTFTRPGVFQPNPKRAGLYSAILPGLGQFYNRQYWKVPVIYAGLAVAGYYFADNLTNYQNYRKAYIGRINNPYPTDPYVKTYTTDQLNQLQNDYNKYLDLTALFTGLGYALQVMEAITAAHLKNFDISRDISLHVQPVAFPKGAGLGLVVNF